MTSFFAMIMLHYLCDQTAHTRALSSAEAAHCMENYQAIKLTFVDADQSHEQLQERAAQNRLAYARFKSWEAENAEIVAELRSSAQGPILR